MTTQRLKVEHLATQIIGSRMQTIDKTLDLVEAAPDLSNLLLQTVLNDVEVLRDCVTNLLAYQSEWQVSAFHDQFKALEGRVQRVKDDFTARSYQSAVANYRAANDNTKEN